MVRRLSLFVLALGVLVPAIARGAAFDFIYADQITMRAPLSGWSITLAGLDFGLIVNKGSAGITGDDLNAATFRVDGIPVFPDTTSPIIDPRLLPGFNSGYFYHPTFTPILPNEARGSVNPENTILTSLVAPGETFHNSSPAQFIYFEMGGTGNAPGPVRFDVHLRMLGQGVDFPIFVTLIDSPDYQITFTHVARVSSVTGPTAAKLTTWGRLKRVYK